MTFSSPKKATSSEGRPCSEFSYLTFKSLPLKLNFGSMKVTVTKISYGW